MINNTYRPGAHPRPRPAAPGPVQPPPQSRQTGAMAAALAGVATTAAGGILRSGPLAIVGATVAVIAILLGFPLVKRAEN